MIKEEQTQKKPRGGNESEFFCTEVKYVSHRKLPRYLHIPTRETVRRPTEDYPMSSGSHKSSDSRYRRAYGRHFRI